MIASPLVQSVYLGVAEAARDLTLRQVARKADDPDVWYLLGEMENAVATARLAVQGLIDLCDDYRFDPGLTSTNAAFVRKTIAAQACLATAEKALEATGGGGLYRSLGLERLLRDVHAAGFHPLPAKRQHRFTGRAARGLAPVASRPRPTTRRGAPPGSPDSRPGLTHAVIGI